jgi:hypothetical protein
MRDGNLIGAGMSAASVQASRRPTGVRELRLVFVGFVFGFFLYLGLFG